MPDEKEGLATCGGGFRPRVASRHDAATSAGPADFPGTFLRKSWTRGGAVVLGALYVLLAVAGLELGLELVGAEDFRLRGLGWREAREKKRYRVSCVAGRKRRGWEGVGG